MISEENLKEYDILGYKIRLRTLDQRSEGEMAIALLRNEIKELEGKPGSASEKILMAALKIAADRVKLQDFLEKELDELDIIINAPTDTSRN